MMLYLDLLMQDTSKLVQQLTKLVMLIIEDLEEKE